MGMYVSQAHEGALVCSVVSKDVANPIIQCVQGKTSSQWDSVISVSLAKANDFFFQKGFVKKRSS